MSKNRDNWSTFFLRYPLKIPGRHNIGAISKGTGADIMAAWDFQWGSCKKSTLGSGHFLTCMSSESPEKTICQRSSKAAILKKWIFHTSKNFTIFNLVAFLSHFYYRNFKIVGRLSTDGFFNWLWTVSHKRKSQKWKSPWNFWSRLKTPAAHCALPCGLRIYPPIWRK